MSKSLHHTPPPIEYFYRGRIIIHVPSGIQNYTELYRDVKEFDGTDLSHARREGVKWFQLTSIGLPAVLRFIQASAKPRLPILILPDCCTLMLVFVERTGRQETEYPLLGCDQATTENTLQREEQAVRSTGMVIVSSRVE